MTFVILEKQEVTQPCLPNHLKTDNGPYSPPLRASQKSLGAKHRTSDSNSSLFHRRHPGATLYSSVQIPGSLGGSVTAEGEYIKQPHSDTVKHGEMGGGGAGLGGTREKKTHQDVIYERRIHTYKHTHIYISTYVHTYIYTHAHKTQDWGHSSGANCLLNMCKARSCSPALQRGEKKVNSVLITQHPS